MHDATPVPPASADGEPARHALVTGGGRGIGAAVVERLVRDGHRVSILGRTATSLDETVARTLALGGDVAAVVCDVTDEAAVDAAIGDLARRRGRIDILVNNAGIARSAPLARATLADFEAQLRVNTTGVFLCTRAVLPGMVEAGWGRVVTVASVAAHEGLRFASGYTASKHAALGLMRALATELVGTGVTANCVSPAYVRTDMLRDSVARVQELTGREASAAEAGILRGAGQTYLVEPDEVADAVAYLVAPAAASINGESLRLAGRA